jgi:hypothetical protein
MPGRPFEMPLDSCSTISYFDAADRKLYELFIIGRGEPTREARSYLDHLRKHFGLEVNYLRYKIGSHRLVPLSQRKATSQSI